MISHWRPFLLQNVLALAVMVALPALCLAQAAVAAGASASETPVAFELEISAPPELTELLSRHLELQRYRTLTDLGDGELLRLLTAAEEDTRKLAATLGYFAPSIALERVATAPGATRRIKLSVAPGPATLVKAVQITFSGPIGDDPAAAAQRRQIESDWRLRSGTRFTQAAWDAAKLQATRQLTTQRYPAGRLSGSLADIDAETGSARLSITLDSGPAFKFGALRIEGLQRQDADMVARMANLAAGNEYTLTKLMDAQQRLSDSGYFDSVFLSLDTTGDPAAAPVRIQVRESQLQKLVLGVGASTDGGARFSAEHTHHKVPGLDWRAVSKLSLDRETRSIGTDLTSPPDDQQTRWVIGALLQTQHAGSFDANSQRLRFGRSQNGEQIDRNYFLQYDRADTISSDDTAPVIAQTLSVNYAFAVRDFMGLPLPASGWGLGVELGGGTTLGSERQPFARVLARGLAILPLGGVDRAGNIQNGSRLAMRAEGGALLANVSATLPSTQLFLAGGDKSVRGYGYREIGVTRADGQTGGGRYVALGSVEWQRPVTVRGSAGEWEASVFVDVGAVADKPAELQTKLGSGFGLRWKSPVGPLQLDMAYGHAVQNWRLHLNVGFAF
jgi:translocation and assembly module TamA